MGRRVAVVGAGMTCFVRRCLETGKELAWEAARTALDAAGLTIDDIDAVCIGTAPDAFDGVHMKGEYLADGAGGWNKPVIRSYVGGGTGVFCAVQGWYHVASGMFDRVLVVAEEKMSSTMPHPQGAFLTIFDHITERPLEPNLLWIFALEMNRYMTAYGIEKADIARVAVKNKRNAAGHPAAQLGQADITVEDVLASEVLAWPVQRLDVSPVSDGAVAVVMAAEDVARRTCDMPVWVEGALFSAGDAHFAQGDGETCGTAIEMAATLRVRLDVRPGQAAERGIRTLCYERTEPGPSEFAPPRRYFATTGMCITGDGRNEGENLTLAARNAVTAMIDHLGHEYGYTRQQAYAICSVAVDLKISQLVDAPNMLVSAFLPEDIFAG